MVHTGVGTRFKVLTREINGGHFEHLMLHWKYN